MYKSICIDFDGTIAHYEEYKGIGVFGAPIEGVQMALQQLQEEGRLVIINTTRGEVKDIASYLNSYKIRYKHINYTPEKLDNMSKDKLIASVYVDDKALKFEGVWDSEFVKKILNFQPWHRKLNDKFILPKKTVPQLMEEAAEIYKLKNQDYGDSYKIFGKVMEAIFPDGLQLSTVSEFNKIGVLTMTLTKIIRYANLFTKRQKDGGEPTYEAIKDTVLDKGVYSFMLAELEEEV